MHVIELELQYDLIDLYIILECKKLLGKQLWLLAII